MRIDQDPHQLFPTTLPALSSLRFLPLLFAQCLLLHPSFSRRVSSLGRLLLLPPTSWLIYRAPIDYGFEPRERCRGLNASFSIACVYALWKTIEWAVVRDTTVYEWVGFDDVKKDSGCGSARGTVEDKVYESQHPVVNSLRSTRKRDQQKERQLCDKTKEADPIHIILHTLDLFTSFRGLGYRFARPIPGPGRRLPPPLFCTRTLSSLLVAHLSLLLTSTIIAIPYSTRYTFARHIFPSASKTVLHILVESIAYTAFGFSAWAILVIASTIFSLLFLVLNSLFRYLLPTDLRPEPFDSRAFQPLFYNPWIPTSVARYWSHHWHGLFKRPFFFLAYSPASRWGGGPVGGVFAVFLFTAMGHEYGQLQLLKVPPSHSAVEKSYTHLVVHLQLSLPPSLACPGSHHERHSYKSLGQHYFSCSWDGER